MTKLPGEFPLPRDAFERQRSLIGAHAGGGPQPSRLTARRLAAIGAVILVGGLLVTPALGLGGRLLDLFESDPGPPGGRTPTWSADGRRIAFLSRRRPGKWELHVVNADGSGPRMLMPDVRLTALSWSPDGRRIAVAGPGQGTVGLSVVNTDGSGRRRLSRRAEAPAWSPDGSKIAYASDGVWVVNADGSGRRQLTTQSAGRYTRLHWSPDGRKLAFLGRGSCGQFCFHLYVMNADGTNVRDLTPDLATTGPRQGVIDPVWSPNGRLIAFVQRAAEAIFVVKPDGTGLSRLTRVRAGYAAPAWSPTGRMLAFVTDRDGNSEVYVMNADGSKPRNLTRHPGYDADPMWSPNGQRITFVSNRDGDYEIHVMNADGSQQRRLTHRDG